MFAHTTTLWFVACPDPAEQLRRGAVADPGRTDEFIARAYVDGTPSATAATDLSAVPQAGDDEVFAAHFGDLAMIAGRSLATTSPEDLTEFVTGLAPDRTVLLLSLDPATSSGTFARWENGRLVRSFSATPMMIRTDVGLPFPFESEFWSGDRPLHYLPGATPDPLDLPFHPAELAEESNRQWLGFRFTPPVVDGDTDLTRIPVYAYEIRPAGADATPAAQATPRVVAAPAPAVEDPTERLHAVSDEPSADPSDAEATMPITKVADTAPDEDERVPGPLSRYFGFRGRL